jgi:RNA polymerase sigma-70 factor (ECF subfamily)
MSEPLKEDALKDSFEKLYIRQTPALVAFAARFIGSDAAEDVVQEIFYKLWKSRMTVLMNENTGSYLFNAVRHACLDELKHQAVHNEYAEKVRLKLKIEELYYNDDPMFLMDDDERLEAVYKAIEKLPKRCREIVTMKYIELRDAENIASLLNISKRTVEAQLYKGLKIIKEKLDVEKKQKKT